MTEFTSRSLGVILDDAIAMYRANARHILLAALVSVFPAALAVGFGQEFYFRGIIETIAPMSDASATDPTFGMLTAYAALALGSWLMILGRAYLDVCVLAAASDMMFGRVTDTKSFMTGGLKRYGWYLLTVWLVQIIVQVAAVASFFALFTGGVVAWTLLSLAAPMTVLEQADAAQAIRRSFELVKPHFWRVLRFLVLVTVLVGLFEGALASPLIVRQVVVVAQNPDAIFYQTPIAWKIAEGLVLAAAMTLVAPVMPLALLGLYVDVRSRSEGLDLIVKARRLIARRA